MQQTQGQSSDITYYLPEFIREQIASLNELCAKLRKETETFVALR
jgi:hypothetical protein